MNRLRYIKDVVSLELEVERCSGCGMCTRVCPQGVLGLEGGRAVLLERDACMECGACALNCPEGALSVNPGVGCASAIIKGFINGTEPSCDCSSGSSGCC